MWHLQVREKGEGSPGALAASSGEDFSVGTEHRRGRLGVVRGGEGCCLKAALPSCEMNARSPILCPKYTDKHYMFRLREDKKKKKERVPRELLPWRIPIPCILCINPPENRQVLNLCYSLGVLRSRWSGALLLDLFPFISPCYLKTELLAT